MLLFEHTKLGYIKQSTFDDWSAIGAIVLVEAKKGDIASGYGQCLAEMVAAMRFNIRKGLEPTPVYGCVSNGLLWRFLKLEADEVTLDLMDYQLEPVGNLLAKFVWMVSTVDS